MNNRLLNDYELRMESEQNILKNCDKTKEDCVNRIKWHIDVLSQIIKDLKHLPVQQEVEIESKEQICSHCSKTYFMFESDQLCPYCYKQVGR